MSVLAFPSTESRIADDLRRTLLNLEDRGWLNYRIVAKIIGATSSELFRFMKKGEASLTPRHLQALQAWRDELRADRTQAWFEALNGGAR